MAPKGKGKKRRLERHLTAAQTLQANRERNLARGLIKSLPKRTVDGTALTAEEHAKLTSALYKLHQQEEENNVNNVSLLPPWPPMPVAGDCLVERSVGKEPFRLKVLPVTVDDVIAHEQKSLHPSVQDVLKNEEMLEYLKAMGNQNEIECEELEQQIGTLGPSQTMAYRRAVDNSESLFLTGGAGKGKTHLLRTIISGLRLSGRFVAVLAPTGVAANHIRGSTVHSFMRLSPVWYKRSLTSVVKHFQKKKEKLLRFQLVNTIVIDEVSMVSAQQFTWLDHIMKMALQNSQPFGGVQIIVCGDFFQLPPVAAEEKPSDTTEKKPTNGEEDPTSMAVYQTLKLRRQEEAAKAAIARKGYPKRWYEQDSDTSTEVKAGAEQAKMKQRQRPPFCFETSIWRELFIPAQCIDLKESFRQRDPEFIRLLNNIRIGTVNDVDLDMLKDRHQRTLRRLEIESKQNRWHTATTTDQEMAEFRVRLFSTVAQVEAHNAKMRRMLQRDDNPVHTYRTNYVLRPWSDRDKARIDDQKMWFVMNRGKLPRDQRVFYAEFLAEYETKREEGLEKLDSELPVDDKLEFCMGARVMLMKNWQTSKGLVHGRTGWIIGFGKDGPLVVFDDPSIDWSLPNAAERYLSQAVEVPPIEWSVICDEGRLVAAQVPLAYAWAMTIHKSQGLSMPRADMDLAFLFEAGQGYVALSRVVALQELGLLNFDPKGIYADPRVIQFYTRCFTPDNIDMTAFRASTKLDLQPPPPPTIHIPIHQSDNTKKHDEKKAPTAVVVAVAVVEEKKQEKKEEKKEEEEEIVLPLRQRRPEVIDDRPGNMRDRFSSVEERIRTEHLLCTKFGPEFVAFLQIKLAGNRYRTAYMSSIPNLVNIPGLAPPTINLPNKRAPTNNHSPKRQRTS